MKIDFGEQSFDFPWWLILVIFVVFIIYKFWRKDALKTFAKESGYNFSPYEPIDKPALDREFRLFSRPHQLARLETFGLSNVISGKIGEASFKVFPYSYELGPRAGTEDDSKYHQTITLIESPALKGPRFDLQPEGIAEKLVSAIGITPDIDFPSNPNFSSSYLLSGKDEQEIRRAFSNEVLNYFENHKRLNVEMRIGGMLVYVWRETAAVSEIPDCIRTAFQIYRLFARN